MKLNNESLFEEGTEHLPANADSTKAQNKEVVEIPPPVPPVPPAIAKYVWKKVENIRGTGDRSYQTQSLAYKG